MAKKKKPELPANFTPVLRPNQQKVFMDTLEKLKEENFYWKTWEAPMGISVGENESSIIEVKFTRKSKIPQIGKAKVKMPAIPPSHEPKVLMDALDYAGLHVNRPLGLHSQPYGYLFQFDVMITKDFNMEKFENATYEMEKR